MTDDLRSELLEGQEVAWLADAGGGLSPASPLVPFAGLAGATAAQSPAERGLSGEPWDRVFTVLRRPSSCVRVIVPGATETLVQYFFGGGSVAEGLTGCWLEGDGLRVSFPWSDRDVVSLTSQVLFSTPPESVESGSLVLTVDGLAALSAAVDAIRSQELSAMAARIPASDHRLDRETLEGQTVAGSESTDARWLVTMLRLTGFMGPATSDAIGRGIDELVAAGLLVGEEGDWRPGAVLRTLAGWWGNLLPTVSYETARFDGDQVAHHEHRIVVRGDGPLCVLRRTGRSDAGRPISIGAVAPLEYFDELTQALGRVAPNEPELVSVVEAVAVRDLETTTAVAGYLQPGRWYRADGEAGGWARVKDPDGPLEGWAPVAALSRWVEGADEVAAIEPPNEPREVARENTHGAPPEAAEPSKISRKVLGGAVAGVALLALVGVLLFAVLGEGEEVRYAGATWSPDGSRLAFVGDGDVYVIDPDGTDLTRIELAEYLDDPAWSPDGDRLAYVAWDGIGMMNLDGSGAVTVAELVSASTPAWSPDGNRLALSSIADGDGDIWLVDVDGSNLTQFTDDAATDPRDDSDPAWSPDGARLAYARHEPDSYATAIWVVSFDGSESSRLAEGRAPAWSPDGGSIAYECESAICVIGADGSNPIRLTVPDENYHRNPAWSPDGPRIAFESQRGDDSGIYVMNPDGSGLVRLAG